MFPSGDLGRDPREPRLKGLIVARKDEKRDGRRKLALGEGGRIRRHDHGGSGGDDRSGGLPWYGQAPVRTMVQVSMRGFRLRSEALRSELTRGGALVTLPYRYTQVVMVSMAQR